MKLMNSYEEQLSEQVELRRMTVELIKVISDLWYENNIELFLFRNQLIDRNVSEVLNLLDYAKGFVQKPISMSHMLQIAKKIQQLELHPSKIDIGKLAYVFHLTGEHDVDAFVTKKLEGAKYGNGIKPKDVVLYGFGRIGRLLARELMSRTGKGVQMRLRAIVTRGEITPEVLEKRASMLRKDSVHGYFKGSVKVDSKNNALIINGTTVFVISANGPEDPDYTSYGIHEALIIDNTGAFRTEDALARHLEAKGADKVLLTAPGVGTVPNIVYGVNQNNFDPDQHRIFSAASCTTNAITPVLKVINDTLGIKHGHIETIHAYTNDQNLVDNMHKKYRRGRAAGLNMVITETGAGKAVSKAVPELSGKLTSNAIRVPVPNGSLAILNLNLHSKTSKEDLNAIIKKYALEGDLVEQIRYSLSNELVSSDIVGTLEPAIFDSHATIVSKEGDNVLLYVWYDNEYGYSHQVLGLAKYISKVRRFAYY
ncbi:glyceraldehyde-3-phosphate dehydrogenase [Lutimonas saemankumensis]|uniref:glyceraldehyde-3-phosphate dehydrogenase n=1 Tax=Lutimonas saemankumensis TaxID=483016 RepID=UPI001CD498BE|nr:glyceraldehyde-3-phosphate dehydrogenase [Lutimonas saemankumensis]MCA0932316.1 glyceraldehyde-3-phosphate dehydrogenase [Lutimonas saemankumensis]